MALFFADDSSYDESTRMTGFYRYRQLLSFYAGTWFRSGIATSIGGLPLLAGVTLSVLSSSLLVLIPASLLGGLIFGPFLAALYDMIMRGLRDAPGRWLASYKKGLVQNWKEALLPGALTGLVFGVYVFMAYIMFWGGGAFTLTTILLYLLSLYIFLLVSMLLWPQLVLFSQPASVSIRNGILFSARYLWRVLGAALVKLVFVLIIALFAPWTVILIPFIGLWYPLFLSQFIIYEPLNRELAIEESIRRKLEEEAPDPEEGLFEE